ncbi:plasma kallikrein-like [Hyla sarda]|uniref:plasma kallikrein-like n=1 Tax=Hyla sarda TaxID=327740 RepID=UPI0024C2DB57|nr:plasma kallikrein-like [Hyla sarda]XP_056395824.1 plasma kallikrein-like [Hyla sarda]
MLVLILVLQLSLLQACPPENPTGGDPPLQPLVDFPGGDIQKIPTPDDVSCQLLCTNHPNCTFFSYHSVDPITGQRSYDCYLKTSDTDVPETRVPNPGGTSGFSLPKTPEHVTRCLSSSYDDVEFVGNVLSFGYVNSSEECEAACTRNPGCQFYTYYPESDPGRRCYLQYSTNLPSPPNITVTPGAQSGFSQRACCRGSQCMNGCADLILPNTLFSGTLIETLKVFDVLICQQLCTQNPLCQFFSYSLHQSSWCECYLWSSDSGLPDNVTSVLNMYSGFTKKATEPGFLGCADLLLPDSEYSGITVLDTEVDTVEECQHLCTSHDLCQFFTVLPGDTNTASGMSICSLRFAAGNIPTSVSHLEMAISGFSLQYNTVQKRSPDCSSLLFPELEFFGSVVDDVSAVDVGSCRSFCTEHPDCKFFTFYWAPELDGYRCSLRDSPLGAPEEFFPATNATSGFSLQAEGNVDCSTLLFPNITFSGSLIGYILAPDATFCQRLCTQTPPCQYFTHLSIDWTLDERRFYCFLQSGDQGIPSNVYHLPNAVSGFTKPLTGVHVECVTQEYQDLNFPGYEERSLKTLSYMECQEICTQDPLCNFFTFFNQMELLSDQMNTCYLKSVMSVPVPEIIKYYPGVTSGFPQRSCKSQTSDSPPDSLPSC